MSQNDASDPTIGEIVGLEDYATSMSDHYAIFDIAEHEAVLIANGYQQPANRAQGERAMLIAKGQILEPARPQTKNRRPRKRAPTLAAGYRYMLEGGSMK